MRPTLRRSLALALSAPLAFAALFVACSSGDNDEPSGPSTFDPPKAGSGGSAGSGGGSSGSGGSAGTAGSAGTGGSGGAPSACFEAPKTTNEFLNRCTDASCSRFDNAARLPLLAGGVLPPLP